MQTARGVVVAAGTLGTNQLLARCKLGGSLPRLSERLGELVRTNSESILAVTMPDDSMDFSRSVAISSSIYPSPDTHVELVTYGGKGDAMSLLFTVLTGKGTAWTRPFQWLFSILRHPRRFLLSLRPFKWSRRTLIVLIMQTLDNSIRFRAKRGLFGGVRLTTEQDPDKPVPTFIEAADASARWLEKRLGGVAQGVVLESLFNIPSTAHILGGAPVGADAEQGVIDKKLRAFGYDNFVICDGAAMPANPGVNPSLTITALAEHAMAQIPPAAGS